MEIVTRLGNISIDLQELTGKPLERVCDDTTGHKLWDVKGQND